MHKQVLVGDQYGLFLRVSAFGTAEPSIKEEAKMLDTFHKS